VLLNCSPLGPTVGFKQTMSHTSPLALSIRCNNSEKPVSVLPVNKTVSVSSSAMLRRTSSTICSFQQPSQARGSSTLTPCPVAERIAGLCHQPPLYKKSCAWRCPKVVVAQICLFGRGDEKTIQVCQRLVVCTCQRHCIRHVSNIRRMELTGVVEIVHVNSPDRIDWRKLILIIAARPSLERCDSTHGARHAGQRVEISRL
jgi:hypothetical protein